MKAMYTYRHNEAVETIHSHVRKGDKGSFYLKCDANKQTPTPHARPTIPQQLVNTQQLTPQERDEIRKVPDITLIENVTHPKQIRQHGKYPIHLFDVGYCESNNVESTSERKRTYYRPLTNILTRNGHDAKFTPIILSTLIPLKDDDLGYICASIGITTTGCDKLHDALLTQSITYLHKISTIYKKKEAIALTYAQHPP